MRDTLGGAQLVHLPLAHIHTKPWTHTRNPKPNPKPQVTCVIPLVVLNWFTFPLLAGICGILWVLLKIGYFVGYGYFGLSLSLTLTHTHTHSLSLSLSLSLSFSLFSLCYIYT